MPRRSRAVSTSCGLARWAALALSLVALLALTGCPGKSAKRSEPTKACTKIGETCSIDEGKLGTCVEGTAACDHPPPCLVCQSQH